MSEKNDLYNKKKVNSSINPAGNTKDAENHRPNSELEHKAKKTNTKR
ncbi:small, acid-soluble spore protein L [Virgibacillus flavescens]